MSMKKISFFWSRFLFCAFCGLVFLFCVVFWVGDCLFCCVFWFGVLVFFFCGRSNISVCILAICTKLVFFKKQNEECSSIFAMVDYPSSVPDSWEDKLK